MWCRPFTRVAERPQRRAVGRRHGHLDRMLDAVPSANVLDEADRARDGGGRIMLQPHGEREVEERLGVGRALDRGEQRGVDGHLELPLHLVELRDRAVVHPQPAAVAERMAVRPLHRRPGRRPDVGEDEAGANVARQLAEVLFVPGWLDALEERGRVALPVPADAEAVTVRRLHAELRVEALVDQRVDRRVEQPLEEDGSPRVREPAAHDRFISPFVRAPPGQLRRWRLSIGGGSAERRTSAHRLWSAARRSYRERTRTAPP